MMSQAECRIGDCRDTVVARGLCGRHYQRERRHGDATATLMPSRGLTLEQYVEANIQRSDGCWLWVGTVNRYGYGQTKHAGHQDLAHRVAYRLWVSEIPDGRTLDHECHNDALREAGCEGGDDCPHRRCCNPDHLYVRTTGENTRRAAQNRPVVMKCRAGHEYDEANTRIDSHGRRHCRKCRAAYARGWRAQQHQ